MIEQINSYMITGLNINGCPPVWDNQTT